MVEPTYIRFDEDGRGGTVFGAFQVDLEGETGISIIFFDFKGSGEMPTSLEPAPSGLAVLSKSIPTKATRFRARLIAGGFSAACQGCGCWTGLVRLI